MFENLYAKIERANNLLASLERESNAFFAENYRVASDLDQETQKYRFLASGNPVLPPQFSVLIGEIVYHLRTVLDHLIFVLAGGRGDPTRLTFPVCRSEDQYQRAIRKGVVKGVPGKAVQVIERLQPYQTSPDPEQAVLYQLHHLNIMDKHRLLLAVAARVDMRSGGTFLVDTKEEATLILPPDGPPSNARPNREGEVIFQFEFVKTPHPDAIIKAVDVFEFKMKFDQMGDVMQDREVLPALVVMRDLVMSVVRKLCPDFLQKNGGGETTVGTRQRD